MPDSEWSKLLSGTSERLLSDLLKMGIFAAGGAIMAWLRTKDIPWAWFLLDTVVGGVCLFLLANISLGGTLPPAPWWVYFVAFGFLVFFLFVSWKRRKQKFPPISAPTEVAKPEPESPNFAPLYFLFPVRSYVNPPDKNREIKLWVFLLNGGTATIHLGKPRWEANKGHVFGYPRNLPLQYEYVGGRGENQQRGEEIDIGNEGRVQFTLVLDDKPGFEKIREWKNMCTLGTLTIPVTFGNNRQKDLSIPF